MTSSGLKLRDTRELLADPDLKNTTAFNLSSPVGYKKDPTLHVSPKKFTAGKVVTPMPPSLAMDNANASSTKNDSMNSQSSIALRDRDPENEPISKKQRILDSNEVTQEDTDPGKSENTSDDILARACSAVGISFDLAESLLEESIPNHQDINGDIQRIPPNYPYTRGVRPPTPSMTIPSRSRPPDDPRFHQQIHPAFRQPGDQQYRPIYGPTYALSRRIPLHPGEAHRYYAVPRHPSRYPYVRPPGSIPGSMSRPPIVRAVLPASLHEHPSSHGTQRYPFAPHHISHASPPVRSPLHLDASVDVPEIHHTHAISEIHSHHPTHREIAYRHPASTNTNAVPMVSPEQLSPTGIRGHHFHKPGTFPVRPNLHLNLSAHLKGPQSPHFNRHEIYAPGLSPKILPSPNSPHSQSPQEMTCANPFQLPEHQEKIPSLSISSSPQSHQGILIKDGRIPIKRNEAQVPTDSPEKLDDDKQNHILSVTPIDGHNTSRSINPRLLKGPPEPCVELIPINAPNQKQERLSHNAQDSVSMPSQFLKRLHDQEVPFSSSNHKMLYNDGPPPLTSSRNSNCNNNLKAVSQELGKSIHSAKSREHSDLSESLKIDANLTASISKPDAEHAEDTNKGPKQSFRKRWLDNQDSFVPKLDDKFKVENKTAKSNDGDRDKHTTVITLDEDEYETKDCNGSKISNLTLSDTEASSLKQGQTHHILGLTHMKNPRSASEPPFETTITSHRDKLSYKRPASVPGDGKNFEDFRAEDENQNKEKLLRTVKTPNSVRDDDEKICDDAFVSRLRLVLNDLLSVPEATKLKNVDCPIDELLASIVKRRGALPSENSEPRQRLRQDFVTLVKLCMPHDLLEDWGWNNSSPEEILDELIKVTNNGVESNKGNSKSSLKNSTQPVSSSNNDTSISEHNHSIINPWISSSSDNSKTVTAPKSDKTSIHSSYPSAFVSHTVENKSNYPASSYAHQTQVSPHPPSIALNHSAQIKSSHQFPISYHPTVSPNQPVSISSSHPAISPPHHVSISPRLPAATPRQPISSKNHNIPHTHDGQIPSSQSGLSITKGVSVQPSHHVIPASTQHSVPSMNDVPRLAHPPNMSPQHSVHNPPLHSSTSTHHFPTPYHSSGHPPTSVASFHRIPPKTLHTNGPPNYRHSIPPLGRKNNLPSSLSEPSPTKEVLEDDVFSPVSKDAPHTLPRAPHIPSHIRPQCQVQIQERRIHENGSHTIQTSQIHAQYPHGTLGHTHSPNRASASLSMAYLHYSQLPHQKQEASQYYDQNSHLHYANTRGSNRVHPTSHFPRGSYPYPYPYYHSNGPHPTPNPHHRPPFHNASFPRHPHNIPHHPFTSDVAPRNVNPNNAVRLVAQSSRPLSQSQWNGTEEVIEKPNAHKHPA